MIQLKNSLFTILSFLSFLCFSQDINVDEAVNLQINSRYADFGVKFIDNNKVLFASSKKENKTKKRDRRNNRHLGLKLYTGIIQNDGHIGDIKDFSNTTNNPIFESNIAFTSDLRTIYFTRNNYILDDYRKLFKKDTLDDHILKLFKASIDSNGELSNVIPLPINNNLHSVTNPHLSADGKKLYFSSNMKGTFGGFDIFEIDILEDGTYSTPENLGDKINSKEDEMFPFISSNGVLYFSSNGHGGLGEMDVFSASLKNSNQSPSNLGSPVNSEEDDFSFVYDAMRKIGYLSSTRRGSVGDADIYMINNSSKPEIYIDEEKNTPDNLDVTSNSISSPDDSILIHKDIDSVKSISTINSQDIVNTEESDSILKDSIELKISKNDLAPPSLVYKRTEDNKECIQTIEGYILTSENTVLDNAAVTLYENGTNIGTFPLTSEGKYSLKLKCDQHYRVTAKLNKFEESYFELKTNQFSGTKTITNIQLEKTPCDILISGKLQDFETKKPIGGAKVYLLKDHVAVDAFTTSSDGNYSFEAMCDGSYKISTDKYGYEEGIFNVDNISTHNAALLINSNIKKLKCGQILNGRINDLKTGKPIISAKVNIYNSKGVLIESADSNMNGNFHFNIDCKEQYNIEVSKEDYITSISDFESTEEDKQVQRLDFNLTPDACLQILTGTILNSTAKTPMSKIRVNLLKDGKATISTLSSSNGTFKFEIECNSSYEVNATTKDYSFDSKTIITDNKNEGQIDIALVLKAKLDFEVVRDQLMILINQIDFDLNESKIRDDAAFELEKVIAIMKRNPTVLVDIGVHTDSRAPDGYNLRLSEERAQSIISFLISKGVESNRLSGKGYGENKLLNKCSNGVKCSETEHLVNRRIEFIVTE